MYRTGGLPINSETSSTKSHPPDFPAVPQSITSSFTTKPFTWKNSLFFAVHPSRLARFYASQSRCEDHALLKRFHRAPPSTRHSFYRDDSPKLPLGVASILFKCQKDRNRSKQHHRRRRAGSQLRFQPTFLSFKYLSAD